MTYEDKRHQWSTVAAPTGRTLVAVDDPREDHAVAPALRRALEEALDGRPDIVARLRYADTTVMFRIGSTRGGAVTLLCDPQRVEVAQAHEVGEVVIDLTEEQAIRMCAGALCIPNLVASGAVGFDGPIRKFLTVAPVLRTLLAEASARREQAAEARRA